jgi:hypothetical protein
MSRQQDRDRLVAQLARELPDRGLGEVVELARTLLRAGATLQRLAEAQCNGDYPYDQGNYRTKGTPEQYAQCDRCETGVRTSHLKRYRYGPHFKGPKPKCLLCPDCWLQDRMKALLHEYSMVPIFNGDPRGAVFLVIPPSYAERNAGRDVHNLEGIYVS